MALLIDVKMFGNALKKLRLISERTNLYSYTICSHLQITLYQYIDIFDVNHTHFASLHSATSECYRCSIIPEYVKWINFQNKDRITPHLLILSFLSMSFISAVHFASLSTADRYFGFPHNKPPKFKTGTYLSVLTSSFCAFLLFGFSPHRYLQNEYISNAI